MATISGGRDEEDFEVEEEGRLMGLSGLAKRASSCADCLLLGERARFLVAWPLRGSRCTGMDSGMFSDIVKESFLIEIQILWAMVREDRLFGWCSGDVWELECLDLADEGSCGVPSQHTTLSFVPEPQSILVFHLDVRA